MTTEKGAAEIPEDLRARWSTYRSWKERFDDPARTAPTSPVLKQLTNDGIQLIDRIARLTAELHAVKTENAATMEALRSCIYGRNMTRGNVALAESMVQQELEAEDTESERINLDSGSTET